jgi:hypothetical protein
VWKVATEGKFERKTQDTPALFVSMLISSQRELLKLFVNIDEEICRRTLEGRRGDQTVASPLEMIGLNQVGHGGT